MRSLHHSEYIGLQNGHGIKYTRVPVETALPYQVAAIAFFVAPVKRLVPVPMFTGALDEGSSSEGIIVAVGTHAEGDRGHKAYALYHA